MSEIGTGRPRRLFCGLDIDSLGAAIIRRLVKYKLAPLRPPLPLRWPPPPLLCRGKERDKEEKCVWHRGGKRVWPRRSIDSSSAHGQPGQRAQVRHLGHRQCGVHGLLREGAREQGRHRAAAPAPLQPQRPRGGRAAAADHPSCLQQAGKLQRRPPRGAAAAAPPGREQQQRGVRPGRQPRRPSEQVRAAAAVPPAAATKPSAPAPERASRRRPRPPPAPGRAPEAARREAPAAACCAAGAVRLAVAAPRRAGGTAEAGGGAKVRGVGRAERGGAGVHGAVREGEAGPGGGPRCAAGRPAPPHAVAGELRERQALPAHPLLLKDVRVLPASHQRLTRYYI